MIRRLHAAFCSIVCLLSLSVPSGAGERVALVIGNSDYEHAQQLPNPTNDAGDMAALLTRLGFDVTTALNQSHGDMRTALADFSDKADGADIAAVFYAGHGIEVDRQNYLVPVDARLATDRKIRFETISLDDVMLALEGARSLRIVMLDACRDNPFAASMRRSSATRSIGRGLSRVEAPSGTLISFAAREGAIAEDGDGRNSPFTTALLSTLEEPVELGLMFRRVRDGVIEATDGRQVPFISASLPSTPIFLVPPGADSSTEAVSSATGSNADSELELALWRAVEDAEDPALLKSYLERYPSGVFAAVARARLDALEPQAKGEPETEVAVGSFPEPRPDGKAGGVPVHECDRLAADPDDLDARVAGTKRWLMDLGKAEKACRAALDGDPGTARFEYQLGRVLEYRRRFTDARRLYNAAARGGHAQAMHALARFAYYALGGPRDLDAYEDLLVRAGEAGSVEAMLWLANHYRRDYFGRTDLQRSADWADKARRSLLPIAGEGNVYAMIELGSLYREGFEALEADREEARRWYRKAAVKGSAEAHLQLGLLLYYEPDGRPSLDTTASSPHFRQAVEIWQRAAERGDAEAMRMLGERMYSEGRGVPKSVEEKRGHLEAAAQLGNDEAAVTIGLSYEYDRPKDTSRALRWYARAAAQSGCRSYGAVLAAKKIHPDIQQLATPEAAALCVLAYFEQLPGAAADTSLDSLAELPLEVRLALQRTWVGLAVFSGKLDGTIGHTSKAALDAFSRLPKERTQPLFADLQLN